MFSSRTKLYLLIDIQPCLSDGFHECFDSAVTVAKFVVAAIQNGWSSTLPITSVAGKHTFPCIGTRNYKYIGKP